MSVHDGNHLARVIDEQLLAGLVLQMHGQEAVIECSVEAAEPRGRIRRDAGAVLLPKQKKGYTLAGNSRCTAGQSGIPRVGSRRAGGGYSRRSISASSTDHPAVAN